MLAPPAWPLAAAALCSAWPRERREGSISRSCCPRRSCPTSWRSSSRSRTAAARSPRSGRPGPPAPRLRLAVSGLVMARAAADARCSARRLHGAPKDARRMLFQEQEPEGGLGAAGRVLYGWDGCSPCKPVSGVDVAFKQIGSDDRIFLCAKSSPLIHKIWGR